jgi:hypothetical protein
MIPGVAVPHPTLPRLQGRVGWGIYGNALRSLRLTPDEVAVNVQWHLQLQPLPTSG